MFVNNTVYQPQVDILKPNIKITEMMKQTVLKISL